MKKAVFVRDESSNRRSFLKGAGTVGLGLGVMSSGLLTGTNALASALPKAPARQADADAITDVDILNFALNLEYLEAEFYSVATSGLTIEHLGVPVTGKGNQGQVHGGAEIDFPNSWTKAIFEEIAYDERQHVLFLRAALGDQAIAQPELDLNALGEYPAYDKFLVLARAFEDVGVSAYGGAAPLIQSKAYLEAAARIAETEAEHSGNIRLLVAQNNVKTAALDSLDVLPPPSGSHYFSVNSQALAVVRNTSQVLAIAYHDSAKGAHAGGFFPAGVNGEIIAV